MPYRTAKLGTKLFVYCADDDFIGFDLVNSCANFLENTSNFSSAHGECFGFFKEAVGCNFTRMDSHALDNKYESNCPREKIRNSHPFYGQFLYNV
jgi:hypothetical protein